VFEFHFRCYFAFIVVDGGAIYVNAEEEIKV